MWYRNILKSNKGSSLTLVLFIIFFMTTMGVAIMALTLSEFGLGLTYNQSNKAYYAAEAGAEQLTERLDEIVGGIQEEAQVQVSAVINQNIRNGDYRKNGALDPDAVTNAFNSIYLDASDPRSFLYKVSNKLGVIEQANTNVDGTLNNDKIDLLKDLMGSGSELDNDSKLVCRTLDSTKSKVFLEDIDLISQPDTYKIDATFLGVSNEVEKRLKISVNLLPHSKETNYHEVVESSKVNKVELPNILKSRALIAEGNLIAARGNLRVEGDALCFGTVPIDPVTKAENLTADGLQYGGIIAGINDIAENATNFDFTAAKLGLGDNTASTGSIEITGNAATMAYVHSVYGTNETEHSDITVGGTVYARCVKVEDTSNYSELNLNTVCITDNLQADSFNAKVKIAGDFKGFVAGSYDIDGVGDGGIAGWTAPPTYEYKRTSCILMGGNSTLEIDGGVYIGGSSFFTNIYKSGNPGGQQPYQTGISAMVQNTYLAEAFKSLVDLFYIDEDDPVDSEGNVKYKWTSDSNERSTRDYDYNDGETTGVVSMNYGLVSEKAGNPDKEWEPRKKAEHFQGAFRDERYFGVFAGNINTGNISIKTTNGRIVGYTNGAIVANGDVYRPDELGIPPEYGVNDGLDVVKGECKVDYQNAISDFIKEPGPANDIDKIRLDYVKPTKFLTDYVKPTGFLDLCHTIRDSKDRFMGIVYAGSGDVTLSYKNNKWLINEAETGCNETEFDGIIYSKGNIYINTSGAGNTALTFKGALLAQKNILFSGSEAKTDIIAYDEQVIKNILNASSEVRSFFDTSNGITAQSEVAGQRTSKQNIEILTWSAQ